MFGLVHDGFAVQRVPDKFSGVGQKFLRGVRVAGSPRLGDRLPKWFHNRCSFKFDDLVDFVNYETLFKIPPEKLGEQKDLLTKHATDQVSLGSF